MFALIFIAGTYFCRSLEKSQKSKKLELARISCHTVGRYGIASLCNAAILTVQGAVKFDLHLFKLWFLRNRHLEKTN